MHDSLHSCRVDGELLWNGINEILRSREPAILARVRHETWTRSDALIESAGAVPKTLADRALPLGAYPLASQFSHAVLSSDADAIILSIQCDVATRLVRHKRDGFLFHAAEVETWAPEQRNWLKQECTDVGLIDVNASMDNLEQIIARIRVSSDAPILIYNLSAYVPGELIHCYAGLDEPIADRMRTFNLALNKLSAQTGISIVDVDTIIAREGAAALKLDAFHLTAKGYALVAAEVVRIFDDMGLFEGHRQ